MELFLNFFYLHKVYGGAYPVYQPVPHYVPVPVAVPVVPYHHVSYGGNNLLAFKLPKNCKEF